jgi:8-oxo-dGTP pyrophosphatase MutT (NUDIX family)
VSNSPQIARYAVAVVMVRQGRFLVIRRSQTVLAPGMFCFPGGGVEPRESEEQAVVREMREELNIAVAPRKLLWRSVTKWRVALAWWLADLEDDAEPVPNPAEVESYQWLAPGAMSRLENLLPNNHDFLKALAEGVVEVLGIEN